MQLPKGATLNEYPPEVQAQLARKPLWPPPAGVKSNFVNPEDRRVLQISITTIFLVIALLFFFNRVYVKLVLTKRKTWDDALLLIAVLLGVAHYCISTWAVLNLGTTRQSWNLSVAQVLSLPFIRWTFTVYLLPAMMMLFLKTSFFVLYLDIFAQLRWAVICSWIGIFATVITHSVFFIYTLVGASPNHGGWATSMTKQVSTPYSIVGLILDLTILIIPILVISRLNMGWQRRVARMTVFCSGGLACVCSCLSIYFRIVQTNGQNHTWQSVWPTILVLVEVFIGIVCACAPAAVHASNHPNSVFRKLPEHYRAFGSRPSTKESNPANPLVHDEPSSLVAVEGLRSTDQKYAPYFELNDRVDGKPRGVKDLGVLPSKPFDELVQKPPATFYRRDAQPTSHPDTEKQ